MPEVDHVALVSGEHDILFRVRVRVRDRQAAQVD